MRQSITPRGFHNWMDVERDRDARWFPDRMWCEPAPGARLAALRCDNLRQVEAQVRANGRVPRVCRYALTVGDQSPSNSLATASAFALRNHWQGTGEKLAFTDQHGFSSPEQRAGWGLVRQQVRAGYADGVVVTTASVISCHADEYEQELLWFEQRCAFVAVVYPAIQAGQL